jgi:hypothetical protein
MRSAPRYETHIECFVELPDGRGIPAAVRDISIGGLRLEAFQMPDDLRPEEVHVVVRHDELDLRLPCRVRHVRKLWDRKVVHAAFSELGADEQHSVQRLIGELVEPDRASIARRWWRALSGRSAKTAA